MFNFFQYLNRYPRYPQKSSYVRSKIITHIDYKSRVNHFLKSKALPRALVGFGTGVALWLTTTAIVGAEEIVSYRYGLHDRDNLLKMEEAFLQNASATINGERVMTEMDFINSVGGNNTTPEERARILACFQLADINKDHHISFLEYALFMHLTAAPDASLQMSFRLFDINGDGYISLEEFKNVVSLHTAVSKIDVHTGCTRLFGDDGEKKLNYIEFLELLRTIRQEILVEQFKADELPDHPDYINPDRCVELLKSRAPSPTPVYLIETFDNMIRDKEPISLSHYLAFLEVMKHLDNIELAIELYTITGGSIDKQNFSRAMHICTGKIMKESEVDVIFRMFDEKNKGVLDRNSLNYIRNKREKLWVYQKDDRPIMSTIKSLLMGAVAAKLSTIIVYPLDKIKTRQQLNPVQLHPLTSTTRRIFLTEGIKGYLRGLSSMLAVVTPEKAIKLTVSNYVRLLLERYQDNQASAKKLNIEAVAGMVTGVVQALIVNPFEQVKIKLQMLEHASKEGTWKLLYKLGLSNFYRGLSVTLIRDILFNTTYFTLFSWGKKKFQDENRLGGFRLFVAHATAASVAVVVSAPADTVRCHFHYRGHITSPWKSYKLIVSQEGLHGLFKGTVPRILVVVPLFALTFTIFDLLQRTFAPGTVFGLSTWQRDLDLIRANRLFNLEKTLKNEYGLEMQKIPVSGEEQNDS